MPYDTIAVAKQIEESRHGVMLDASAREEAVEIAAKIYRTTTEAGWEQRVQAVEARRWVGIPLTPLTGQPSHVPSAPNYCVVASDSSFVAPDKHRGALCHLVNVGRVMVRYGEAQAAELDNVPSHYTDSLLEGEEVGSARVLAAKCALRELEELCAWAERYHADLALLDGSLMQLVSVLSKDENVLPLMTEYFRVLQAFRAIKVPVVGYISRPASQMVMRAVRMLACDRAVPCERRPDEQCGCSPLWSIDDSDLFWELLGEGERSAIFEPLFSHLVGPNVSNFKEMVFAYLGTPYELVRLEFPVWVEREGLLAGTIEQILHQCKLGQGYPNALTLAHQFAVLHNADRESYYFLLERAGLMRETTQKARGKRLIGQSI